MNGLINPKGILFLAVYALINLCDGAESLPNAYSAYGQLILTSLASAPFPHPARAKGHQYKDQFYPATEHYADSTVAIFVPHSLRENGRLDFVVHFHGWNNHVNEVLRRFKLIEQLALSGRNAVLVVPQGPRNAPDSSGGKLEDAGGFKRFMAEVMETLKLKSSLKNKDVAIGDIILSGHSGGYQVISSILDRGGLTGQVKEVWLFDALYARTDKFLAWFDQQPGRWLNIYTEHGGTKQETEQLMAKLKQRSTTFLEAQEAEINPVDLRKKAPIFLFTALEHNDVLDKHETFRVFLTTSFLQSFKP